MAQMKEFQPELKSGATQTHRNMRHYHRLSADEAPMDFQGMENALATVEERKSV